MGLTLLDPTPDDPGNPLFSQEDLDSVMGQMSVALAETFKAALQMPVHFQVRSLPCLSV